MSNVSMVDGHIDKPMTNYERIRNMSIEEMAEAMNKSADDGLYNLSCQKYCAYTTNKRCNKFNNDGRGGCTDGIKQWLESEVETE